MIEANLSVAINSLGYGVCGFNIWREMNRQADVTLWPMQDQVNPPRAINEIEAQQLQIDISKQENFQPKSSFLKVWHENRLAERIGNGFYSALSFFEVNKFDTRRKTHMESADQILVPSEWALNIVEDQLGLDMNNTHIIPMGVDREVFNESLNNPPLHKCVFFNCGKWEVRKGHDILKDAFQDAFPNNSEVELHMMCENPFLTDSERHHWEQKYQSDRRIKLIPRVTFQHELAQIMGGVHCGVFPARAEGWNLELLEMMSMGKIVITTDYAAHTQFCHLENSLLLDICEEEPIYDGKWFKGDCGTWAALDGTPYDQLVSYMRDIYGDWQTDPARLFNEGGIETAKQFSWENTVSRLLAII